MESFGLATSDHHLYAIVCAKLALLLEVSAVHIHEMQNLPFDLVSALLEITEPAAHQPTIITVPLRPDTLPLQGLQPESQSRTQSTIPASRSQMKSRLTSTRAQHSVRPSMSTIPGHRRSRMGSRSQGNSLSTSGTTSLVTTGSPRLPPIGESVPTTPEGATVAAESRSSIPTLPKISTSSVTTQPTSLSSSLSTFEATRAGLAREEISHEGKRLDSALKRQVSTSPSLAAISETAQSLTASSQAQSRLPKTSQSLAVSSLSSTSSGKSASVLPHSVSTTQSRNSAGSGAESNSLTIALLPADDDSRAAMGAPATCDESGISSILQPVSPPCSLSILGAAEALLQKVLDNIDAVSLLGDSHQVTTDHVLFMVRAVDLNWSLTGILHSYYAA